MVESGLKSRIYSFTKEDVFSIQRQNIYSDKFFFFSYCKPCNSLQVKFLSLFSIQGLDVSIFTQET